MNIINTKNWWESFYNDTEKLTKTKVIKNAFNSDLINKLNQAVMIGLKNRILTKDSNGLRIYFPEKEQAKEDYDFIDKLFELPPNSDEDITDYSNRIFKEKFGMILNYYEKHSDFISTEIRDIVNPLLEIIGIPATGIDITVFIGNYGWTPLGIHQDHIGENVIHFHLGPGAKKMYTWDEEKYKDLTNTKQNNFDIEPLLEYAEEYEFNSGDIYFMPWNKYHIGKTDDLSVGITLWFNNPTKVRYFDKIMNTFYTSYIENDKVILEPFHNYLNSKIPFEEFLSVLKENNKEDFLNLKVKDFFEFLNNEFKYSLISNGGWQATPLTRSNLEGYDVNDFKFLIDQKIIVNKHFPILYTVNNKDTLYAFVRGSKITVKYTMHLEKIIQKLNSFEIIEVGEILKLCDDTLPIEAGLYFLSMIYDRKGFEII